MKKQVKKSSGKMSMFRRLTLGEIICAYITIGLAITLGGLFLSGNDGDAVLELIAIGAFVSAIATFVMAVAQMVAARHYGDIYGKLTRKNTTIIFVVFTILAWVGIVVALVAIMLGKDISDTAQTALLIVGIAITLLSAIGYTVASTIAFAKSK